MFKAVDVCGGPEKDRRMTFHQFSQPLLSGAPCDFSSFAGQVLVVVNVASKCGFTRHYAGLQALHENTEGVTVLGFPCNQFGAQEPGTHEEIASFCEKNYGVTFPMFEKVDVKGDASHPAFAWLTSQASSPVDAGDIKWNFAKFVIGKDGAIVGRFAPDAAPDDRDLLVAIERALAS